MLQDVSFALQEESFICTMFAVSVFVDRSEQRPDIITVSYSRYRGVQLTIEQIAAQVNYGALKSETLRTIERRCVCGSKGKLSMIYCTS